MKYLRKFNTTAEKNTWQKSEEHVTPNVVISEEGVQYNIPKLKGVYIQHINGELYRQADWEVNGFEPSEANGVAVVDGDVSIVIAKSDVATSVWAANYSTLVDGVMATTSAATAANDIAGSDNTEKILALGAAGAAYLCRNYIFPNGRNGYLPAYGEMKQMSSYRAVINAAMILIGGTEILTSNTWTSTQYNATQAWIFWSSGNSKVTKSSNYRARPVTAL